MLIGMFDRNGEKFYNSSLDLSGERREKNPNFWQSFQVAIAYFLPSRIYLLALASVAENIQQLNERFYQNALI